MMIECKTCKKKISKNAKVCPNCGEITEYAIKNRKKMTENIIIIIIAVVAIGIGFMFAMRTISIRGSWKRTEDYEEGFNLNFQSRYGASGVTKGKKMIIYTFKDNGKCSEKTVIDATNFVDEHCNARGRCFNASSEPYKYEEERKCEYTLDENGKNVELFFYEEYNEQKDFCDNIESYDPDDQCIEWSKDEYIDRHYLRLKDDNMYIDGDKYAKIN